MSEIPYGNTDHKAKVKSSRLYAALPHLESVDPSLLDHFELTDAGHSEAFLFGLGRLMMNPTSALLTLLSP